MSVDILQEKIRKMKCPLIVDLSVNPDQIPPHIRQDKTAPEAYVLYCTELMEALRTTVPAVRFSFDHWALMDGLEQLRQTMARANELGYYVLLDGPAMLTPWAAERAAALLSDDSGYPCHGMVVDPYIGSDAIKAFVPSCKEGKSVFFAVRTPNKSAVELQDLMTGSRLVHLAAADLVNRYAEQTYGKSGYSHVGVVTAATNANAVIGVRTKFKKLFFLVDGLDYPSGNGKIASHGFDRFGHGCAVSVGPEVVGAWRKEATDGLEYAAQAVKAAERIRNNFGRYFTIL